MLAAMSGVPGVVIAHSPASTGCYLQCPAIVRMPDGALVASHSRVGPGTTNSDSVVYRSADRGGSWERLAELHGQVWSNLFLHAGALYIMGTDHRNPADGRLNGKIVIRRSDNGGRTWTTPLGAASGLLTDSDGWHTAPVPAVVHRGRVWRAFEFAPTTDRPTWRPLVVSAPENADLLDRKSWTFSEQVDHPWSNSQWIEGNVVVAPDGSVVDVLRTNHRGGSRGRELLDRGVIVHVADDGVTLSHDPDADAIMLPGGGTKFTIRLDTQSRRYCALVNPQAAPGVWRNVLSLVSSADLRSWTIDRELLRHPDAEYHAFQYVDWVFDGEDIAYVSRTSFADGVGGAHNAHDANHFTFHRLRGFRELLPD